MKRVRNLWIITLVIVCASLANSAAQKQPDDSQQAAAPSAPMPFDLAFHRRELADIALSPDGKLVAYAVHTPPAQSTGGDYYLPNGVPSGIPDRTIFISEVATGKQWQAGPEGSNSWRPAFSADGSQLAFYCDKGNAPHLWVYDIARRSSRQLGTAVVKPQVWQGDEPQWGADGKEIFVPLAPPKTATNATERVVKAGAGDEGKKQGLSVTVRRTGDEEPKVTDEKKGAAAAPGPNPLWKELNTVLAAINVQTGSVRTVVPADATPQPNVLGLSPSGKWVAYVSVFHPPTQALALLQDLAVIPASGGSAQVVASTLPVRQGNLRGVYVWHPTRDQVFWFKDGKLWTAEMATQPVAPRQIAETLNLAPGLISFTRDGSAIMVGVRSPDKPNTQAQAIVPLNGDPAKLIEAPAGLALFFPLRQRDVTLWQPQPDAITMFGREPATGSSVFVRLSLKSDPPRILWKGVNAPSIVGSSVDQTQLVGVFGDMNTPTDIYRISPDFSKRERITELEPRLTGIRFGPVETFQTEVRRFDGGSEVTSTILLPPGAKRGDKLPTVVVVYPRSMGMGTQAMTSFGGGDAAEIPASLYTTRGYAVLYTQAPIRPLGQPGNIISDILAVIEPQVRHAIDLGYTDVNRIAVTGHSFGGYSTAALLSATNLFRAGVANAGSYDLAFDHSAMGPEGSYFSELGKIQQHWNMRGNLWEDLPRYIEGSPFFRADRIQAPLLIVHGINDNICNIEEARLMFNALRQLGKTAQLAEYAGEGHFFSSWSQVNITDAAKRMLEFLDKYLAAPKTATR